MLDSDPIGTFTWIARELNNFQLAYFHVMRSDFLGEQKANVMVPLREAFKGVLVGNMGYSAEEADSSIKSGHLDAVAFGVPFLANPDLPERFKTGAPLNSPRQEYFYSQGPEGYTDYPKMVWR
jgi:N-ethylmaleimide reductase